MYFEISIFSLISIFYKIYMYEKIQKPKGFIKHNNTYTSNTHNINRNRFNTKKIPTDIDVIIIGSGISGLTTAGLLARVGKKVLVLEQHYVAGGCTHCFEDKNWEFDTGIHYIGNIKSRNKVLNLIMNKPIDWIPLGHDNDLIYDNIIINDKTYSFKPGKNNMIDYLNALFPREKQNIKKYINLVQKVAKLELYFLLKIIKPFWFAKILIHLFCKDFIYYSNKSEYEIQSTFFKDEKLKAVLSGLSVDGGPPPKEQSFFIHAGILNHFIEGGFYPRGGPSVFAKNIIPIIEKNGGQVLVNANVEQIIVKNGKAMGVQVNDIEIYANTIVSSVGIKNTYIKLLSKATLYNNYFNNIILNHPSYLSYNFLFVGLDGSATDLGLNSSNIYTWDKISFDETVKEYYKDPFNIENINPPIFIASSSAKDLDWIKKHPKKSTLCVISWSNINMFNTKNKPRKRKDIAYTNNKKKIENILWKALYKFYPLCKDKVLYSSTSTSETVKYYMGSYNGECYGLDANTSRFNYPNLRPETNIKNLYLTGQDIVASGFGSAITSGVLTVSDMLGYNSILDIIKGRNILDDIKHTLN